jgi:hypothetical protein
MSATVDQEQIKRWRLILGQQAQQSLGQMAGSGGCQLSPEQLAMDEALAAIYDETSGEQSTGRAKRSAGLGPSAPNLAKWLGDIRSYFKEDVVTVIQNDAIERKGLTQLLFEPEMLKNVEPNPQLVGTLMSLKGRIPERTKETARMVVRAVVCAPSLRKSSGCSSRESARPLWARSIATSILQFRTRRRLIGSGPSAAI